MTQETADGGNHHHDDDATYRAVPLAGVALLSAGLYFVGDAAGPSVAVLETGLGAVLCYRASPNEARFVCAFLLQLGMISLVKSVFELTTRAPIHRGVEALTVIA